MLNPFPELLSFAIFAPFILRLILGIVFIYISYFVIYKNRQDFFDFYRKNKYPVPTILTWFFGSLNLIVGMFFVVGFLTQIISLFAIYLLVSLYLCDKDIKAFEFQKIFYVLAISVSFCMLFLGAGIFAVDLPL